MSFFPRSTSARRLCDACFAFPVVSTGDGKKKRKKGEFLEPGPILLPCLPTLPYDVCDFTRGKLPDGCDWVQADEERTNICGRHS